MQVQAKLKMVNLEDLDLIPDNPRFDFSKESLMELAESLKTDGMIEPIVVRPKGERYELVVGERRARAAAYAGLMQVPALIRDINDEEASRLRLIENINRKDLDVFERVKGIKAHMDKYNLNMKQMASLLHIQVKTLTEWFRLSESTSPKLKVSSNNFRRLGIGHLRYLAKYNDETQEKLAEVITNNKFAWTQARRLLQLFDANPEVDLNELAQRVKDEYKVVQVTVPKEEAERLKKNAEKETEKLDKAKEKVKEKLKERLRRENERKLPTAPILEKPSIPEKTSAMEQVWETVKIPYAVRSELERKIERLDRKVSLAKVIEAQKLDEWETNYLIELATKKPDLDINGLLKIVKEESTKRSKVTFMVLEIEPSIYGALNKESENRGMDIKSTTLELLTERLEELGYTIK
jgi:ParB family chromosome partitioning protein